jgi:hypothetical protein
MASASRQEIVNVGIIVFRPEGIDIRMLSSATKVRLLDGSSKQEDLESLKSHFKYICSEYTDPAEQVRVLNLFKGRAFISSPAFFGIDELSQYESKVSDIFNKLVKPNIAKKRKYSSRFSTVIKNIFKQMEILAYDSSEIEDHKVVHNYQISNGLSADFLLKNGAYHLTETIDYNLNDLNAKHKETSLKLLTFIEGQKSLEGDVKSYFVYRATPEKEFEVTQQIDLAESYSDKVFNFSSKEDKSKYFELINSAIGTGLSLAH